MPAQPHERRRPATAAVELTGVYRRFGRTMVLAGLDLRVGEGELYGLIGPNGAGKTTACGWPSGCSRPTPARSGCSAA
ncbi:MAG TPA: ATP-binding cassette domain-containing protein, partial [Actinomycetota bacterium]|nr:ATP-binding cassette domain-containing protein [Actinomycetota bacterium]